MAFCIFDEKACCTDWMVMNLMPGPPPPPTTQTSTTTRCSSCKRKAKYKVKTGELFFCDAHAKRHDTYVIWTMASLRKKKVDELRQLVGSDLSKAACLERLEPRVLEPTTVALPKKSANDADLIGVGRQLCLQLDAASLPERIDMVIIENQISPLAARMRTLQGMVTQYFILRYPEAQIQYVSSIMKLKAFSLAPTATAASATAAQKYKQHKVDGVAHCAAVLRANPSIGAGRFTAETLLSHAKKDDLADCWLQALWFLKHVGKINWSAEDLKIKCVDA